MFNAHDLYAMTLSRMFFFSKTILLPSSCILERMSCIFHSKPCLYNMFSKGADILSIRNDLDTFQKDICIPNRSNVEQERGTENAYRLSLLAKTVQTCM